MKYAIVQFDQAIFRIVQVKHDCFESITTSQNVREIHEFNCPSNIVQPPRQKRSTSFKSITLLVPRQKTDNRVPACKPNGRQEAAQELSNQLRQPSLTAQCTRKSERDPVLMFILAGRMDFSSSAGLHIVYRTTLTEGNIKRYGGGRQRRRPNRAEPEAAPVDFAIEYGIGPGVDGEGRIAPGAWLEFL